MFGGRRLAPLKRGGYGDAAPIPPPPARRAVDLMEADTSEAEGSPRALAQGVERRPSFDGLLWRAAAGSATGVASPLIGRGREAGLVFAAAIRRGVDASGYSI